MFKKITELTAEQMIAAIHMDKLQEEHRIIWETEDNIIFLATKDTFIDILDNKIQPDDIFEIWQDI